MFDNSPNVGPNVTRKANLSEMEECISDICYLKFFSDSVGHGWHLKMCISNKSPSDTNNAGWGNTLWGPLA